jgi:signal peptide peptidase SppA
MIDAFHVAAGRPWLIQEAALETILAIAERHGDIEALQTRLGRPLDNARTVEMRDGVAVIPVTGPIFRYANLFTEISGATSTEILARDIQAAIDNRYVRGIVLDINSPGGEATGINELADLIAAARKSKPIVGYGGGTVASGAYWLASAAGEIVIDATALVGSIGVVMSYLDTRKRDEKADVRRVEIVSSQSPDKRIDPNTDAGRAKVQSIVDAMAQVFVEAVARNRAVTPETVLTDFGQGGLLVGAAAVGAGMADRIGSLESVIAQLAGATGTHTRIITMADQKGRVTVATTEDLRTALAAGYDGDHIDIAPAPDTAAARQAGYDDGVKAGRKESAEQAVVAERQRIAAIQSMSRAGFEKETAAAIEAGDSPEKFAMALLQAAGERGITLDAIKRESPPAASHAKPGSDATEKPKLRSPSAIYESRRKAVAGAQAH